ncbi:MAG: ABC transporter substrate-binding protein [Veillonellales bacterium]
MYQIGILQLTQNLDDAVQGFKQGLSKYGLQAEFHYLNADGNTAALPDLAKALMKRQVDLIFACSTPAAKAAANLPGNIPVVFTPVFDPVGAGLVNNMALPGGKITGVSGMVKSTDKIAFIHRLLPNAKTIGVLYHTGDSNAQLELTHFQQAAQDELELRELPVHQPEDLSKLSELLPAELDALFLPIGRIIEENFATVVYYTDAVKLPIIASHAPNVSFGALGALVANHHCLGVNCAAKAAQILSGTAPGSIPVGVVEEPEILLNDFTAQNLGIKLPINLKLAAKEIYE